MKSLPFDTSKIFQPTILLAIALMSIIVMMILPMPAWVLDIGLVGSFGLAILIFTTTLFIERPLDFSAFPTVLLASLMLRLSLNVSSTKLIIGQGHTGTHAAGEVIQGFAMFVMGGSVIIGLVVFGVLLIVNFVVITKGAARMAEVGARFALDGMPGKQLAIDSDLSAGAIDHETAKARRSQEQAETTFFGSLDGASKFVKGDAIAGLLITALNLIMGLVIGLSLHGMPIGDAFTTYAILTVGDGLVTQIPAVIISIASALLLARGGATGSTDMALAKQLGRNPAALSTVALLMALLGFVPGLPILPFLIGALALGGFARIAAKRIAEAEQEAETLPPPEPAEQGSRLGDVLAVEDIHLLFAPNLVPMVLDTATGLDMRITNMRRHLAESFGVLLSEVRLTDDPSLEDGTYVIRLQGVETVRNRVKPDQVLALLQEGAQGLPAGEDVREPVYGAPARWIDIGDRETASLHGLTVVAPTEVISTHLLETIKGALSRLMTLSSLRALLDQMTSLSDETRAAANRRLFDELIPDKVPMDLLLIVLRMLLDEQVSIRNLPLIMESIAEARPLLGTPEAITEHVRQRLGFQIIAGILRQDGCLPLVQLAPEWERRFETHQVETEQGRRDVALPPDEFNRLTANMVERMNSATDAETSPALVTAAHRRRFLRTVARASGLSAPVLSYEEIGIDARPAVVGVVPP
ncbi:MAG: flagellar biosynthesis protein FlhA [Mangrovicoccus sp.]|nr:flagellar biosynthesis protein FlhA [Mangrovicoccus sp.]